MNWAKIELQAYKKISQIKFKFLKPLLRILAQLGMTPSLISYSSIIFMLFFFYFIDTARTAAVFLILALVMDLLDGALAKYLRTESDKGKFTDKLIDSIVFVIFVVALVYAGLFSGIIGVLLVYFGFLCELLSIIKKNIKRKSNWLIYPMAGFFPVFVRALVYVLFFIYAFFDMNYFNLVWIIVAAFIVKSIQNYFIILTTKSKR